MKLFGTIAAVILLTLPGCKKKEPTANAGADAAAAAEAQAAAEVASTPGAPAPLPPLPPPPPHIMAAAENAPRQDVAGPADPFLTQQLQIYVKQTGRMPRTFAEFAGARLDSVPRPPQGMKWVIDAARTEVKAVPAR